MEKTLANRIWTFVKSNAMPTIAIIGAIITCFFVPITKEYLSYFNMNTLACLFCTLAVVCAYKNIKFFTYLAKKIVTAFGNLRNIVLALVFVTYFGSMIMANDMALITFLPLGFVALDSCNHREKFAFTFIMQNIAANLGGMLTPFGNPQNLYLFSYYRMNTAQFLSIMFVPFLVAFVLIFAICMVVPKEKTQLVCEMEETPSAWRCVVYGALFVMSVLIVFNVVPWYISLAVVTVSLLFLDKKAFAKVDYGLLLTFSAFFVFSGNLSNIDAVQNTLGALVEKQPLLVGTLCCQVISNVPTAVLLSHFTTDVSSLLVAVNIGGLGTPIASLASLITLNEYRKNNCGSVKRYLALFLAINFSLLAVLFAVKMLIG